MVVCAIETRHALSVPRKSNCGPVNQIREELEWIARPCWGEFHIRPNRVMPKILIKKGGLFLSCALNLEVMEELTKQIKRDMFDIRENINNPDKLMELFSFSKEEFEGIIHNLKFSVEGGLFEFKITSINLILDPLKSLQYDSRAMGSFDDQIKRARGLLAVTLIQRLIAVGAVKVTDHKAEDFQDTVPEPVDLPGIKEILEFVNKETKTNPASLKDPLIKKIFMHIKMYQNETLKMNELTAKVSEDKRIALKRNFEATLGEQVTKMRETYNEIINRSLKKEMAPAVKNILVRYDYKSMNRAYMVQIETFSRLLSSLLFARNEKFQTRELLLALTRDQKEFTDLIDKERGAYCNIAPFDTDGSETGGAFVKRIIEFLGKEKDWLRIHPGKQAL